MSVSPQVILIDSDSFASQQLQWRLEQIGLSVSVLVVTASNDIQWAEKLQRVGLASALVVAIRDMNSAQLLAMVQQVSQVSRQPGSGHDTCLLAMDSQTTDLDRMNQLQAAGADEVVGALTYSRDIARLIGLMVARAERGSDPTSPMLGSLAETGSVFSLLRTLCSTHQSGVLALMKGLRRGEIRFFHGEITSAQIGFAHGQSALHQMLLWTEGRFEFRREMVVRRQQIPLSIDQVFKQAQRFLQRLQDSSGTLTPSDRIERNHTDVRFAAAVPKGMNDLLRLFDGTRTLAEVLDDSPYRHFETLRVTLLALDAGVLQRAADTKARPTWQAVIDLERWLIGGSTAAAIVRADNCQRQQAAARADDASGAFATWADLSPRASSVDIAPVSQVVPVSQTSGEISVPNRKSSPQIAREGLEHLLDTETRQRVFVDDLVDSTQPSVKLTAPTASEGFVSDSSPLNAALQSPGASRQATLQNVDSIMVPLPTAPADAAIARAALQAAASSQPLTARSPSAPVLPSEAPAKRPSSPDRSSVSSSEAPKRPSSPATRPSPSKLNMPKSTDAVRLPDFTADEEQFFSNGATKIVSSESFEDLDEGYRHESFWERLWGKPRTKRKR